MSARVDHIRGSTFHGRRGGTRNAFRYGIDYVLCDAEKPLRTPALFSRNGRNLFSLRDRDFGGPPGEGSGPEWVRRTLSDHGLEAPVRIELLAQPRVLGHLFNPVSFWLCRDEAGALRTVIAEVTNTFGDRHSYLCHREDRGVIGPTDRVRATKIFHVSPFQPVEGEYTFRFRIDPGEIDIVIDYRTGDGGVVATLTGARVPMTNRTILGACLRRPFGSRRVLALIHWQALRLWWKRAPYRPRPEPPAQDVSR
ncbi:DUF1365 domain-containing protein [Pelagovum pacificum]|uniref:DUF1365 domain-containing protein n=1 Tax=Pelagovum pacificum TaxID=2588711 RepID=A0A5C5GKW9_9RHOB|nr:DUF1365 domain-containing protein [Pelagovum pacificum]